MRGRASWPTFARRPVLDSAGGKRADDRESHENGTHCRYELIVTDVPDDTEEQRTSWEHANGLDQRRDRPWRDERDSVEGINYRQTFGDDQGHMRSMQAVRVREIPARVRRG